MYNPMWHTPILGFSQPYLHLLQLTACEFCQLGRGHTMETDNRNTTTISENCYQTELTPGTNGETQIEETATQLQSNSRKTTEDWKTELQTTKQASFISFIHHSTYPDTW
jgi:hypothetical protein